jgi:hypothetical protein
MLQRVVLAVALLAACAPALAQPIRPQRCLTPHLMEARYTPEKVDPALMRVLDQFCSGASEPNGRPIKQRSFVSSAGHFRIHFDTDGMHAVEPEDVDANGVPDFIDSVAFYLEHAWDFEINVLGYAAPPPEPRGAGPEIDVFICELGLSYYGGAIPETGNTVGTNPFREHGYMVLDNDFQGSYKTKGIDAVRVTAAHEFHHIIEFASYRTALGGPGGIAQYALYESTATWMEEEVHPDVDDWDQYVNAFLDEPHRFGYSTHNNVDATTGYAHMLYLEYLEKRFGRNVIREIWEEFRLNESFDAIDRVLQRRDYNLARSYCEFAEWAYYTGHRAKDTTLLPQAADVHTLRAATTRVLEQETSFEDELFPLSFGLYRLLVPTSNVNIRDTVDFLVTNNRSDIGAGGPTLGKEPFRVDVSLTPGADFIPHPRRNETLYYRLVPLEGGSADMFCLDVIDDSVSTYMAVRTSPQPFINRPGEDLLFAVDAGGEEVRRVKVWILTAGLTRVVEFEQEGLKARDNQLGVLWNGRDRHGNRVPSGVYIYEMSINDKAPVLGKFAVVRE